MEGDPGRLRRDRSGASAEAMAPTGCAGGDCGRADWHPRQPRRCDGAPLGQGRRQPGTRARQPCADLPACSRKGAGRIKRRCVGRPSRRVKATARRVPQCHLVSPRPLRCRDHEAPAARTRLRRWSEMDARPIQVREPAELEQPRRLPDRLPERRLATGSEWRWQRRSSACEERCQCRPRLDAWARLRSRLRQERRRGHGGGRGQRSKGVHDPAGFRSDRPSLVDRWQEALGRAIERCGGLQPQGAPAMATFGPLPCSDHRCPAFARWAFGRAPHPGQPSYRTQPASSLGNHRHSESLRWTWPLQRPRLVAQRSLVASRLAKRGPVALP